MKENEYIEFYKKYKEKQLLNLDECKYIDFYLSVDSGFDSRISGLRVKSLFKLDEQDLQYLYEKYKANAKSQVEDNIKKLNQEYDSLIK